jgi:hypothetical protein
VRSDMVALLSIPVKTPVLLICTLCFYPGQRASGISLAIIEISSLFYLI